MGRGGFGSARNTDRATNELRHGRSSPGDPARRLALCSNDAFASATKFTERATYRTPIA